jgi:hypothetical protein
VPLRRSGWSIQPRTARSARRGNWVHFGENLASDGACPVSHRVRLAPVGFARRACPVSHWVRLAPVGFGRRACPVSHWVRLAQLGFARRGMVSFTWRLPNVPLGLFGARLASLGAYPMSHWVRLARDWLRSARVRFGLFGLSMSVRARQSSRDHHRAGGGNCPVNSLGGEAR